MAFVIGRGLTKRVRRGADHMVSRFVRIKAAAGSSQRPGGWGRSAARHRSREPRRATLCAKRGKSVNGTPITPEIVSTPLSFRASITR